MLTPAEKGEVSALVNTSRTLGGFSVAYFQVPWAIKNGALQTLGVEAACAISATFAFICSLTSHGKNSIVVGLFVLIIPALQLKGRALRVCTLFLLLPIARLHPRLYGLGTLFSLKML
jgi:hypothetical protein